jgi:hypothetical protein
MKPRSRRQTPSSGEPRLGTMKHVTIGSYAKPIFKLFISQSVREDRSPWRLSRKARQRRGGAYERAYEVGNVLWRLSA